MTDFDTENGIRLDRVAMPIVLLMGHPELTWVQREACAKALQESLKQYGVIMTEVESLHTLEPKPDQRSRKPK